MGAVLHMVVSALVQNEVLPGGNVLACETYSLTRLFREKKITLEEFPAKMKGLGIKGISLNDLYFVSWDEPYLNKIRSNIRQHERVVVAMVFDLNANFALDDDGQRKKNIEAIRQRLPVAKFFGAPVVRINVGSTGRGEDADRTVGLERVIAAFKELVPTAKELEIKLAIENHRGSSLRAAWIRRIIEEAGPQWVGACVDFKNWAKDADPYAEVAVLAPYAVHTHAKSHHFGDDGEETEVNYARVFKLLKEGGYRGAVSIEFEGKEGDPVEGVQKTRDLILKHWR